MNGASRITAGGRPEMMTSLFDYGYPVSNDQLALLAARCSSNMRSPPGSTSVLPHSAHVDSPPGVAFNDVTRSFQPWRYGAFYSLAAPRSDKMSGGALTESGNSDVIRDDWTGMSGTGMPSKSTSLGGLPPLWPGFVDTYDPYAQQTTNSVFSGSANTGSSSCDGGGSGLPLVPDSPYPVVYHPTVAGAARMAAVARHFCDQWSYVAGSGNGFSTGSGIPTSPPSAFQLSPRNAVFPPVSRTSPPEGVTRQSLSSPWHAWDSTGYVAVSTGNSVGMTSSSGSCNGGRSLQGPLFGDYQHAGASSLDDMRYCSPVAGNNSGSRALPFKSVTQQLPLKSSSRSSPVRPGRAGKAAATGQGSSSRRPSGAKSSSTCECPNCREAERLGGVAGEQMRRLGQHSCHIPGCGKVYAKTSHLKAHLHWHTGGERPFVCSWTTCGKRFTRTDELQRHLRTHGVTGSGCSDKTTASPSQASAAAAGLKFSCTTCDKSFARSDQLAKHARSHQETNSTSVETVTNRLMPDDVNYRQGDFGSVPTGGSRVVTNKKSATKRRSSAPIQHASPTTTN